MSRSESFLNALNGIEKVIDYLSRVDPEAIDVPFIETELAEALEQYSSASPDYYRDHGGRDLEHLAECAGDHLVGEDNEGMIGVLEIELQVIYNSMVELSHSVDLTEDSHTEHDSESFDDWHQSSEDTEDASTDTAERSPVSKNYEAYIDPEKATEKRWERAVKTESKFFDIGRAIKEATKKLADVFLGNRTKKGGDPIEIDSTKHSKRALIMADAGAVAKSTEGLDWDDIKEKMNNGTKHTVLAKELGWHNRSAANWNRQAVHLGDAGVGKVAKNKMVAKYQEKPAINNLSNFFLSGVGTYHEDILPFINKLTGKDPESEMVLAKMLLKYSATKQVPAEKMFVKYQLELSKSVPAKRNEVIKFNKVAFLVVVKEVSRRIHHGPDIPQYPFGVAIAKTLILLSDGHLKMADVFGANAKYGVFTGSNIMDSGNLKATKAIFNRVFDLYDEKYAEIECNEEFIDNHPKAKLVPYRIGEREVLGAVFSGGSDSEGDPYESSDEETQTLRAQYL